jgi:hypothetical protein
VGRGARGAAVQTATAQPAFERAFREYGLPIAIRIDNGVPFRHEYNTERPPEAIPSDSRRWNTRGISSGISS